jgi:hypothetical protein
MTSTNPRQVAGWVSRFVVQADIFGWELIKLIGLIASMSVSQID